MKNLIYFYLVLLIATPSVYAKKQQRNNKENPNLEYKDEQWMAAINQTKEDWKLKQEDYVSRMNQYYQAAYNYNYYDEKIKSLEKDVSNLQTEIASDSKKTEGDELNAATKQVLAAKIHNNNLILEDLSNRLEKAKAPRDRAEAQMKDFNPEPSQKDLDDAAKVAYANISVNDSKWVHRAEKISEETINGKVSDEKLRELNEQAQGKAKSAFWGEFGIGTKPKITDAQQPMIAQKVVKQKPTEQKIVEQKLAEKASAVPLVDTTQSTVQPSTPTLTPEIKKEEVATVAAPVREPAVSTTVPAPAPATASNSDCDAAKAEIVRTLLAKGNNPKAFSDMVYIAQLKMAYRLAEQKPPVNTIEGLVKQQGLQASAKASYADDQTNFKKDLTALYEKYGEAADLEKQALLGEKEANYTKVRLNNDSASAVILYLSKNEQNSSVPFTEQDAAAVWAQQKLASQYTPGTTNYGLLNFSTRVCQMYKSGACSNPVGKSTLDAASIQADYQARNQKLEESLQKAGAQMLKEHPDCFTKEGCEKDGFKLGSIDLEAIKGKIAQLVGKGSLDGSGSKVEVDTAKTKAQGGDLTIYLKTPNSAQ